MVLSTALGQTRAGGSTASGASPTAGTSTFRGRNGPIAFRSDAGVGGHESHAIWQVAPDGTGAKRITRGFVPVGFEDDYSPTFFADGRRFAYISQSADRELSVENQIYVKALSAPPHALGSPVLPVPADYRVLSLAVSPDGSRLAVAASPPPLEVTQIFSVDVGGGEMTQLTSGRIAAKTPDFSPDGRQIVFARPTRGNVKGGLFTIDADGSSLRRLTSRPGDGAPSWSPSGDRIVFNGHSGRRTRIFSVRADGAGRVMLTRSPAVDRGPVYSPDGRSIAFSRWVKGQNPHLWVMRADGAGAHLLFASPGKFTSDTGPDWGPKPR
jgi:Tol biopolymer transport system component